MKSFCKIALIGFLTSFALGQDPAQKTIEEKKSEKSTLAKETTVIVSTSLGDIHLELDSKSAPTTVKNFLKYVDAKHYDGTIFHRIIGNFMVQGGGMESGLREKASRAPIKNEANNGLSNKVGTLAMARTMEPHSASSQFFINVNNNTFLDFRAETPDGWGYCVFGEVVEGMDIVNKIKTVSTGTMGMHQDVPLEEVFITSTTIEA